jgi:hypothetical protein
MAPRAALVPIRACRAPIALPALQHLLDALEARDDFLAQWGEDAVADYLDGLGGGGGAPWGREEVVDCFVVDLEVGAAQEVFACGCSADVGEDVFH